MSKLISSISFKTGNGSIHFGDNAYGELFVLLKGPRGGERGDDLISREDARKLALFILEWLGEENQRSQD